jgi:hypothetical protein
VADESKASPTGRRVGAMVAAVVVVVALGVLAVRLGTGRSGGVTPPGAQGTRSPAATHLAAATTVAPAVVAQQLQLLRCIRQSETGGNYTAVSPSGEYFGAYQFDQQTWNATAEHAGATNLVGVQPNEATPADQDAMALALLQWQGTSPWNGDSCVG